MCSQCGSKGDVVWRGVARASVLKESERPDKLQMSEVLEDSETEQLQMRVHAFPETSQGSHIISSIRLAPTLLRQTMDSIAHCRTRGKTD